MARSGVAAFATRCGARTAMSSGFAELAPGSRPIGPGYRTANPSPAGRIRESILDESRLLGLVAFRRPVALAEAESQERRRVFPHSLDPRPPARVTRLFERLGWCRRFRPPHAGSRRLRRP